jgi:predicted DNA-binding transcriptional regulator AlpA
MAKLFLSHSDLDNMGVTPKSKIQRRRLAASGNFPRPTKSGRSDAFFADEIAAHVERLRAARDELAKPVARSACGKFAPSRVAA